MKPDVKSPIVKIVGVVAAVLIVIIIAIPFLINVNNFRPQIESKLSTALGRPVAVSLTGELSGPRSSSAGTRSPGLSVATVSELLVSMRVVGRVVARTRLRAASSTR